MTEEEFIKNIQLIKPKLTKKKILLAKKLIEDYYIKYKRVPAKTTLGNKV